MKHGSHRTPVLLTEWQRFFRELKRRKVYRVAAGYAAVAFVVVQVVDLMMPAFALSTSTYRWVVILALLGFPVAVLLAWVFEITPEGVRVTQSDGAPGSVQPGRRRLTLEVAVMTILVVALGSLSWYLAGRLGPASSIEGRSLAVLPFESIGEESSPSIVDGIHDDLLTRLSNIGSLRVIAASSVLQYRNSDKSGPQIASELGVALLVEGGVQRLGDQVKVNVKLVDPHTATQIWAEGFVYELTAGNLFSIQAEIVQQIAQALDARLTAQEQGSVEAMPTQDLEAYRLVVEGTTLLRARQEPEMREALARFREAADLDPDFAMAWVGVANALYELVDYGFDMPADSVNQALSAAATAHELDPDLPEALVALGIIDYLRQDGPAALRRLERAIELRPNYAEAFSKISWVGQILGKPDMAYEAAVEAVALDPQAVESRANLALLTLIRGDGEAALSILRPQETKLQAWPTIRFYEGVVLHHLGHYQDATERLRGLDIPWAGAGPSATQALSLVDSGEISGAEQILDQMHADDAHPFLQGLVLAGLGDDEGAFAAFESVEDWTTDADWPILSLRYLFPGTLEKLREDPRYDRMLRKIDQAWGLVM
ncbi:MAG: hypothetical protein R3212_05815 [Xanthomonadales bacterium]|nr:hypothetical protein [Xanthomonadales bacterium]